MDQLAESSLRFNNFHTTALCSRTRALTTGSGCRRCGDNSMSTAVDEALDKSGGDALLNATVSSSLFGFIPYYNLFAFTCTSVSGTAIRFEAAQQLPPATEPPGPPPAQPPPGGPP